MATASASKRKRVVLTIKEKVNIIQLLEKGTSYTVISEKYGIGRSTVGDIRKNKDKILKFSRDAAETGFKKKAKVMKPAKDEHLEEALYIWFKQKRMEGIPISGPVIKAAETIFAKFLQLNEKLGGRDSFAASEGWKWRFCKRYGIHQLAVQGEQLSSDPAGAEEFITEFRSFVKEKGFTMDQLFNCDETGLNYRLLPSVTMAPSFEKHASGRKKAKERVTLNLCSNASGTIKLPVHLIGKSKRPRCFKKIDMSMLPVKYSNQSNAWMTANQFSAWFHEDFVPLVHKQLTELQQKPTAVLVLDNCLAHPAPEDLASDDGAIFAKFLPPNVTALIQPMDQGVISSLKIRYKKKLLRRLIIEDDGGKSMVEFLKGVNMRVVVELVHESWNEITGETLRKSWRKIIPIPKPIEPIHPSPAMPCFTELYDEQVNFTNEEKLPAVSTGCGIWRGLRIRIRQEPEVDTDEEERAGVDMEEFKDMFKELGFDMEDREINQWIESDFLILVSQF